MEELSAESDDAPRSLHFLSVLEPRRSLIGLPHVKPLTSYAEKLLEEGYGEVQVPYFDPLDGGINARALFLMEKPGPMTATGSAGKKAGSGFISRNNDDPTAENICHFMRQAEIPREQTVLWNIIPAWNGTLKITSTEHQQGINHVHELLALLPQLRVIVMVGSRDAKAKSLLEGAGLPLLFSAHPSPILRATNVVKWNTIPLEWAKVHMYLSADSNLV
ncbi:MAG: uracil-DNA glycosylase [Janthinobacterium lividum]